MQRFALGTFGLSAVLAFAGCVGSLSNPEDFIDGGTGQRTAEVVFADKCGNSGCHDAPNPPHMLDLVSPNVESRVVGVNASGQSCESYILVVAGDPGSSYLRDKINDPPLLEICGSQMPVVAPLEPSEIDIIEQWIIDLGSSNGGTPDGG